MMLGRDPYLISDENLLAAVESKRILITGAGGSIGSALAVMAAQGEPESLLLVSHSELPLYNVEAAVKEAAPEVECATVLGDVRSFSRMKNICREFKPDIVIHAAAIKHVPMAEKFPCEAVMTNITGSANVAMAAFSCGAERLVFISTDKAVHPACVMGATKRLAERYLAALPIPTSIVRFGNVFGTSGSVVPLFTKQIESGGPVTITHPDMERYFMGLDEAASMVMETLNLSSQNHLFVLDMGEPVKIVDLAKNLMEGREIPIEFTGLRPGEKLTEDLFYPSEAQTPSLNPRIYQTDCRPLSANQLQMVCELEHSARIGDEDHVRTLLNLLA